MKRRMRRAISPRRRSCGRFDEEAVAGVPERRLLPRLLREDGGGGEGWMRGVSSSTTSAVVSLRRPEARMIARERSGC